MYKELDFNNAQKGRLFISSGMTSMDQLADQSSDEFFKVPDVTSSTAGILVTLKPENIEEVVLEDDQVIEGNPEDSIIG